MLDLKKAKVTQPSSEKWEESSDHTPLLYKVRNANLKQGKLRISKEMLSNQRNSEEAGEFYRQESTGMTTKIKQADNRTAEGILKEVSRLIEKPWSRMVQRKPKNRSPHWNKRLDAK